MSVAARKLSFQEAWESITVFFVDEALEQEIDREVEQLLGVADQIGITHVRTLSPETLAALLQKPHVLELILHEIQLSQEKFLRIISLLRRIGRIPVPLDAEWSMQQLLRRIRTDRALATLIATVLLDGCRDPELRSHIPRYYLEALNLREIATDSGVARRVRYKHALLGTYSGRKGYAVENHVAVYLRDLQQRYGIGFARGRSRFVETDIDFAIPSLEDPWVILMCSFQETTSSGQSAKARDMLQAYERVRRMNVRYGERRAFVNFVDGGGWLARKRDLERLVENCDYYLNLAWLNMLEAIVLTHVPQRYFRPS